MNTLIINGHPDMKSFTGELALKLQQSMLSNNREVTLLNLAELDFNPVFLGYGSLKTKPIEEDLVKAQKQISDANHIIIITPIWWSTYPALLKGFFDKVLLPGFAFKFQKGKMVQDKLLKGKTAELILMSDAPAWYRRFILGDPATKILKRDILGFCGIKVNKVTRIGNIGKLESHQRDDAISKLLNS